MGTLFENTEPDIVSQMKITWNWKLNLFIAINISNIGFILTHIGFPSISNRETDYLSMITINATKDKCNDYVLELSLMKEQS